MDYTVNIKGEDLPGTLTLRGLLVDVVVHIGSVKPLDQGGDEFHQWRAMAGVDQDPNRAYVAGGTCMDAYWRTLCLNIGVPSARRGGNEPASLDDRMVHDQWWFEELLAKRHVSHEILSMKTDSVMVDTHIHHTTAGRRFFITKRGYFGLGHGIVAVGDQVCVLAGGKMPFILREHSTQMSERRGNALPAITRYSFVRDAYVHGLMHGEAMESVATGDKELQDLVLV